MNQIEKELLDLCISNSRMLFKEMEGEFYPFGSVYTKEDKTAIYYNEINEEYPSSIQVLNDLILNLYLDFKNNKFLGVATCALATRKVDSVDMEYLDVRILLDDTTQIDYCIIIYPDYVNYTFENEEPLNFVGTFKELALSLIE
jgi:hypothetical protein